MYSAEQTRKNLLQQNIAVEANIPLSEYVTFRVGGPCDLLVKPNSITELQTAVAEARSANMPFYILGNGSNLLVSDDGFRGMVILTMGLNKIELFHSDTIICQAGISLSHLCSFAYKHSLGGLEFAFGIPGSVGGAIYMNAGAYGGEIKDVIDSVEFIDEQGKLQSLQNASLDFSYRHSFFSDTNNIILCGTFRLKKAVKTEIRGKMDDYLARRKSKQPLELPSAGSTFKRPEGNYASALIEQCGLKGYTVGGAQVSEKHSGFIVNRGNATCADICELIAYVKQKVYDKTGYRLCCEVKKLGF